MVSSGKTVKAFAYLRTSSATNVGEEKDSKKRQLVAIEGFARRAGFEVVSTFADDAVSGEDDIGIRPGFSAMLDALEANGVRVVLVEDASRFARKLVIQETGIAALIQRDVVCWSAAGDIELTNSEDEFKVMMRQVAAAFAQLEKTRLVKKLRSARDRKRESGVKVEGRKGIVEREGGAAIVAEARKLYRKSPKTGKRRSLRDIAGELAAAGYLSASGTPYSPSVIHRMVVVQARAG